MNEIPQVTRSNADTQLSESPQERSSVKKPSMIGWLDAAKEAVAKANGMEKQSRDKSKKHDAECL